MDKFYILYVVNSTIVDLTYTTPLNPFYIFIYKNLWPKLTP